jgi:cytochrome c-type biogenesis protein
MGFINSLIDTYNIPILTALFLGLLTSISPCPLATNITAVAYLSKSIKVPKYVVLSGLFYTLGRGITYTLLATLIYFGISSFQISRIFQGWGDKILGPALILIGLVMFGVIKINLKYSSPRIEKIKLWLAGKGYSGALALGIVFAFAFCPYSGVLFFGILIPLVLKSSGGLLLPPFFALGTGLPVVVFAFLIAFSMKTVGKAFQTVQQIERWLRYGIASIFIITGIYYMKYLVEYLK